MSPLSIRHEIIVKVNSPDHFEYIFFGITQELIIANLLIMAINDEFMKFYMQKVKGQEQRDHDTFCPLSYINP